MKETWTKVHKRQHFSSSLSQVFSCSNLPNNKKSEQFCFFFLPTCWLAEPGLNLIRCCNELNAGNAIGCYARSRDGVACVVTFTVGGLSVLNAIARAYSENLPLICIVGGPNSNDYVTNMILHHTIELPDLS